MSSNTITIKTIADGTMQFITDHGIFELPFEVICQASDEIRQLYIQRYEYQGEIEPDEG